MTLYLHLITNSLWAGSYQRRHMVQVEIKLHRRYVTVISGCKISERGLRFLLLLMTPEQRNWEREQKYRILSPYLNSLQCSRTTGLLKSNLTVLRCKH